MSAACPQAAQHAKVAIIALVERVLLEYEAHILANRLVMHFQNSTNAPTAQHSEDSAQTATGSSGRRQGKVADKPVLH